MLINIWWFLLIVPISLIIGFILAIYYIKSQIAKATGIKSFKDLEKSLNQARELQKKMKDMNNFAPFNSKTNPKQMVEEAEKLLSDPNFKKQMEEFKKKLAEKENK